MRHTLYFRLMICGLPLLLAAPRVLRAAELLVPAYQYPTLGTMWSDFASAASSVRLGVIMNPASGPGIVADSNYLTAIADVRAYGGRIYGYVDTAYAARPSGDVLADVVQYQNLYAVTDGIFLDQMANAPADLAYYAGLTAGIHALMPGGLVIANPGTSVPESFVAAGAADVIVTYENNLTGAEPYAGATPPAWTATFPPRRLANIVYNVPDETTMQAVFALMVARNVGEIYITSRVLPNPYDELPPYWAVLVAAVAVLPPDCPADMTGEGVIDMVDVARFQPAFAGSDVPFAEGSGFADTNNDGDVDMDDLALLLGQLGSAPCVP